MIDSAALANVLHLLLPSIREHITASSSYPTNKPYILGLSGLQGSGKSTWAAALCEALKAGHGINAITVSLDDFYHTHDRLVQIREENGRNALLRTRGQPGTHDEDLVRGFFASLVSHVRNDDDGKSKDAPIRVPSFDKGLYGGEGDRVPPERWREVPRSPRVDAVVFEGWCIGFRPRPADDIASSRALAQQRMQDPAAGPRDRDSRAIGDEQQRFPTVTLHEHGLGDLLGVNANLARYFENFMGPQHFDGLVHLVTQSLASVYRWRLGQEHALWEARGTGMPDEEVVSFVRGYMPAYELYLSSLADGNFFLHEDGGGRKRHVQVRLDENRRVVEVSLV